MFTYASSISDFWFLQELFCTHRLYFTLIHFLNRNNLDISFPFTDSVSLQKGLKTLVSLIYSKYKKMYKNKYLGLKFFSVHFVPAWRHNNLLVYWWFSRVCREPHTLAFHLSQLFYLDSIHTQPSMIKKSNYQTERKKAACCREGSVFHSG